jgi:Leucine-rich repeat (LRR) protein
LTELSLSGASISDISPLVSLPNLTKLVLEGTNVRDFTPLKGLTNLHIEVDGTRKTVA